MSTNLFDYLTWRGDITCEKDEFNQIDGMILSRFVYAPFEYAFTAEKNKASIKKVCERLISKEIVKEKVLSPVDIDLFLAINNSPRFSRMKMGYYVNRYDEIEQTQFSAITVQVNKNLHVVVFRGTDDTIIGWKENLNMGFVSPIASQRYAVEYLDEIARLTEGRLILAGHSKGGNLAAYAAAFSDKEVQSRITEVYNYDGPGFVETVLEQKGYQDICDRIHTYVPQGSIVGMLLGHKEKHEIVHSNENVMPLQHVVYSWEVLGKDFVYEENTTNQSRYLDNTMTSWLATMDNKQRELFIEGAFSIIAEMDAKTLTEVKTNWFDSFKYIVSSMKNLDDETKKILNEGIKLFMKSARNSIGSKNKE